MATAHKGVALIVTGLIAIRGVHSQYHNNGIQTWKVASNGIITNGNRA